MKDALGVTLGPLTEDAYRARVTVSIDKVTYSSLLHDLDGLVETYAARGLGLTAAIYRRHAAALRGGLIPEG